PPKAYVEEKLDFGQPLQELIRKGKVHGFITAKEIVQAFPDFEDDIPQMDDFFHYCFENGIEVLESPSRILRNTLPESERDKQIVDNKGKKKVTRMTRVFSSLVDSGPSRRELEMVDEDI